MSDKLKQGAPTGTIFSCNPSGWGTGKDFNKWTRHFIKEVNPTAANPVLLILDGHSSHTKNLEFSDLTRENNIHVLSLPPHCSHKLQPLDVSFMGPFKTYFSQAIEKYLKNHPGEVVTLNEVSGLLGQAYLLSANMEIAENGFRKTGIFPFNRNMFGDADFAPADVTDIPLQQPIAHPAALPAVPPTDPPAAPPIVPSTDPPAAPPSVPSTDAPTAPLSVPPTIPLAAPTCFLSAATDYPNSEDEFYGFDNESAAIVSTQSPLHMFPRENLVSQPTQSSSTAQPVPLESLCAKDASQPKDSVPITASSSFTVSPLMIRPLPKSIRRKVASNRKTEKSTIITSSPHRNTLKMLQAKKDINQIKKLKRNSKALAEKRGKRGRKKDKENLAQDTLCYYCGALFSTSTDGEGWNQCHRCHTWVHDCTAQCACNN